MENKSKYSAQMKHIKENYKRFHINLKFETFNSFNNLCKKNGSTPTTELRKFIEKYIAENS